MERIFTRSAVKNDQQLVETCKTRTREQKTVQQENVLCCEITNIGDKNKNIVLPLSKTNDPSNNMPNIRRPDRSKAAALRRETNEYRPTSAKDQLSVGLSDLGPNSKLSLPHRPLTTGRLLPRIGRKHLLKESSTLLSKPSLLTGTKLSTPNRKISSDFSKATSISDSKRSSEKDSHKTLTSPTSNSSRTGSASCNTKASHEDAECLLAPNNLQTLSVSSVLIPSPPGRKSTPTSTPKTSATSVAALGLHNTAFNTKQAASSGGRKATSEVNHIKTETENTRKLAPGTNFKSMISVTNLQLGSESGILKTNKTLIPSGDVSRTADRQNRDRKFKLRHTHPPPMLPVPPSNKSSLSTIIKPGRSNVQ